MFFYVYVLESKNDNLYVGFTADLNKRFKEHNLGLNVSTKPYIPWKIIYFEAYLDKDDALRREGYLKTTQGSRFIKRVLREYRYKRKIVET